MRRLLALVTFLSIALAACVGDGPPADPANGHPATLAGTSWTITAIGGTATAPPNAPTIAFGASQAQGSGGCNQFGGRYRYDPTTGALRFDEMGMTAMACLEPARNAVETALLQVLGQPFLVVELASDGHLVVAGGAGRLDLQPAGAGAD